MDGSALNASAADVPDAAAREPRYLHAQGARADEAVEAVVPAPLWLRHVDALTWFVAASFVVSPMLAVGAA